MPNRLDYRHHPQARRLREQLPKMQYVPLVGATDLREITRVFAGLPPLEYPINSAGQLLSQLGDGEKPIPIAGMEVNVLLIIKRMPAYYFPIASPENFVEKMAELIRANRKQVDAPAELLALKTQLPELRFPIDDPDELVRQVGDRRTVRFRGRDMEIADVMRRFDAAGVFPIQSADDFDRKVATLMATREIVIGD
jgi:hypothetical protein